MMANTENENDLISDVEPLTPEFVQIDISEDFISFKFGEKKAGKSAVLSEIRIKPDALYLLSTELFNVGVSYEKIFQKSIGFSDSYTEEI